MNLALLLDMARDGFADRVLLGSHLDGITTEDLHRRSVRGAAALRNAGSTALIYLGVNGPAFPVSMFAAVRAGIPLVPLNYRLGDEQLETLLAHHPGALAVTEPERLDRVRTLGIEAMTIDDWLARTAGQDRGDLPDGEAGHDTGGGIGDDGDDDASEAAVIIYTSGTTSAPKGVVVKHSNLLSYVFGTVEFGSADPAEAALVSVPPYHIAAVANTVTNLYAGRRTVVLEQFSPDQWLAVARQERITNAMVVPTMLVRIMSASGELQVPSLRAIAYGGAAMPLPVIERALRAWPDVDFVNAYGLTETSSTIAVLGPADHREALASADAEVRARLSSAGRVVPAIELQIRDDDGAVVRDGRTGRIFVRGDQVSGEYTGSGSVLDTEGFFDTRDVGHLDSGGYLFVHGRADDTIIRGGENIAPAEIEDVLLNHPDIVDAVVVGVPDDEWGQRLEAAVVLRVGSGTDGEALRRHVRQHLRGSKTPERILVWDELPRTETGKLIRREAVRLLADDARTAPV
ncbi:class I adenylate-forming enzyme family protein [uncultured Jatrophihabitans sp.]|uniref:class I adenylate-forming enzyme family protein n=1 Tax=uncultured Jatrophihabitans sp. TaxID=1610747 RepID=UPI0035CC803D